jgi:hypothetical protein
MKTLTSDNLTALQKAKDLIEKFGQEFAFKVAQELFNETDWSEAPFWEEVKEEITKQQEQWQMKESQL